jgi:hypothetical protein
MKRSSWWKEFCATGRRESDGPNSNQQFGLSLNPYTANAPLDMLRRYQRLSVDVGRLPSLLGRKFFRTRVTLYHPGTFEDAVIFVHDVASGLAQPDGFEHKLIAKLALQDYTQNETARWLAASRVRWADASRKRWTG